uniref:Uncharacterized protein LOC104266866 n=1 Tax=Phallusia mammillata TaxID=59560 RepID=A0A6F9DJU7_9ASCI|nr:uncharacterized protein LOC104266866 [Phallusia mammillata]
MITIDVIQRVVQPVFTSGIGTLYNHGEDVVMMLQLRDSFGQLLQNIEHKGLTWHASVSLDDDTIYGTSVITGNTTYTFNTSTSTIATTGLKISTTQSYHKYNLLFRVYTTPEPVAYDLTVTAEPIQFYNSETDDIHEALAATQTVRLLIMGRPYTTARTKTFKVYLYNKLTDEIRTAYIGSLEVADATDSRTTNTDVNTEVTLDINTRSNDDVLQAVEDLKAFVNGSHGLMFDGNAIQFSESQCGLTVCVVTTTTLATTTDLSTTTSATTTTESVSAPGGFWIIIGVAIVISIMLAGSAIGLACYLKRNPRSKVSPCMGSQTSLGAKSLIDSIPSESSGDTVSSYDGLHHRPRSAFTPVHV